MKGKVEKSDIDILRAANRENSYGVGCWSDSSEGSSHSRRSSAENYEEASLLAVTAKSNEKRAPQELRRREADRAAGCCRKLRPNITPERE